MKAKSVSTFVAIALLGCLASNANSQTVFLTSPAAESPQAAKAPSTSLPPAAREIFAQYESAKTEIRKDARKQIRDLLAQLLKSLQEVQDRYTRDAKLDEAVAVRDSARALKQSDLRALPDPGWLYNYNNFVGRTFFFRVTGSSQRTVWGVDVYTTDSGLAPAAVHAGVLKLGQTGVVKVTILSGLSNYQGSTRNGITTSPWSNFPASFKVEPASDDDVGLDDDSFEPPSVPTPNMTYRVAPPVSPFYNPSRPMPDYRYEVSPQAIPPGPAEFAPQPELPPDARQLTDRFQAESAAIKKAANRRIAALRRETIEQLKPLQDDYTRNAQLDEAVAIRDCIRSLKEPPMNVLPDPGSVNRFPSRIGGVFYFRVAGARGGAIWGTDVYTSDSTLAASAVHAGVLKEGQNGVVKVTILPGQPNYQGSTRNGIASYAYGPFPTSFKVEAVEDDEPESPIERDVKKPGRTILHKRLDDLSADPSGDLHPESERLRRQVQELSDQLKQLREEVQSLKKSANPGPLSAG